jgi:hypothetical protein
VHSHGLHALQNRMLVTAIMLESHCMPSLLLSGNTLVVLHGCALGTLVGRAAWIAQILWFRTGDTSRKRILGKRTVPMTST